MGGPAYGPLRSLRAMCAASHSCYASRSVDDKKVQVDETNVDVVLLFDRYHILICITNKDGVYKN